jgi:hypothetical protein
LRLVYYGLFAASRLVYRGLFAASRLVYYGLFPLCRIINHINHYKQGAAHKPYKRRAAAIRAQPTLKEYARRTI